MNQFAKSIYPDVIARMGIHMHNILTALVPVGHTIIRNNLLHNTLAVMMSVSLYAQTTKDNIQGVHGVKYISRKMTVAAFSSRKISDVLCYRANWLDPEHLREFRT